MKTQGEGWIGFTLKSLLLPLVISAFAKDVTDPAREVLHRLEMKRVLNTLDGTCFLSGHVSFDLRNLTATFETRLLGDGVQDVCLRQTALNLAGHHPGPIDGILGPQTRAAESAFMHQWNVPGISPSTPEYAHLVARALRGAKPPTQP